MLRTRIICFLCAALPLLARDPECRLFAKVPVQFEGPRLVEYLSGTETRTNACVQYAILRLGALKYAGAVDVLVNYLDFTMRPPNPDAIVVNGGDRPYPATTALHEIGRPAVPALVRVTGSASASELARTHAVERVMGILGGEAAGIRVFMEASRATSDPDISARLAGAAREALKLCGHTAKPACAAVLMEHGK